LVKFSHEEKSIQSINDQVNCMDMLTNIHSVPLYSVEGDNSEMYVMFSHLESGGLSDVVQIVEIF